MLTAVRLTNTERQREFRARNPGYYQRWHARRRALLKALGAERRAREAAEALAAAQPLGLPGQLSLPFPEPAIREPLLLPAMPERLALPAPVETPAIIAPLTKPEPVLVPVTLRDEQQTRRAA